MLLERKDHRPPQRARRQSAVGSDQVVVLPPAVAMISDYEFTMGSAGVEKAL
jgi:hypothetical protein